MNPYSNYVYLTTSGDSNNSLRDIKLHYDIMWFIGLNFDSAGMRFGQLVALAEDVEGIFPRI